MKYLVAITLALALLLSCINPQLHIDALVGKWKCYHKELEDGTTKSTDLLSGKEFEYSCNELVIELKPDATGKESLGEQTFKYALNDSILSFGNKQYVIELLSKKELIIRDYDAKSLSVSIFRQKFKRIIQKN